MLLWAARAAPVLLALVAGFIGLALLFGDLGPGETMSTRVRDTLLLRGMAGLLIGVANPLAGEWRWWRDGAACRWACPALPAT